MELLNSFYLAFSFALSIENLLRAILGGLIGFLVGVLPGFGSAAGIAVLIPFTFSMHPTSALIMLATMWGSTEFGGAVTAVLLNIPGEASAVITSIEGYPLAKQGKGAATLSMTAFASAIGGAFGVICFMLFAPPLAAVALEFGPAEFFSLVFFTLTFITFISEHSLIKGFLSCLFGLFLSIIGQDIISGEERFTFGSLWLSGGINFLTILIGMFAVAEIFISIETSMETISVKSKTSNVLPTKEDWKKCIGPIFRGSVIGTFIGALPGAGASIASFISYVTEKKLSKYPEKFGTGVIEGVAGPEAANNSVIAGAMIPTFTLGIPGSSTAAVLLGGLMLHGLRPGPNLFLQNRDIVLGLVGGMYIGNLIALIIGLTCVRLFTLILRVPYYIIIALIMPLCILGIYSINSSINEVLGIFIFGAVGYVLRKLGFSIVILILAFILGPLMESSLRQALIIFDGRLTGFLQSPIPVVFLALTLIMIILFSIQKIHWKIQGGTDE